MYGFCGVGDCGSCWESARPSQRTRLAAERNIKLRLPDLIIAASRSMSLARPNPLCERRSLQLAFNSDYLDAIALMEEVETRRVQVKRRKKITPLRNFVRQLGTLGSLILILWECSLG